MSATSASSSLRAEHLRTAAVAVAGVLLFLGCWQLLHVGFWSRDQIVDTPVYQGYGEAMAHGEVPYRDFRPEYPPLAMPVFVLPALVAENGDADGYQRVFEWLMAACGAATVAFTALAARALGRGLLPVAFVAVFPLALGSVVLTRFDLWPAALTAAALAALLSGRDRLGAGLLGAAVAAKLYPAVLLPLALAWTWRRKGRRAALLALGVFAAVVLACFLPFVVLGADGVWYSLSRQLGRPLQIESLGAGFLLVAHQLFGLGITMKSGAGSQNLAGRLPHALSVVQSVLQAAVLIYVWLRFARARVDRHRLALAAAAAVVAFVALGKVLSPQFLIWLAPVLALVGGLPALLGLVAMAVTQVWFPFRYWDLAKEFDALPSWLVLVRDLLLVAVLLALVSRMPAPCRRRREPPSEPRPSA